MIRVSASTATGFGAVMIDLSGSTEPDLRLAARVLARVDAVARAVGVEYLVVGATARTILSIGLVGGPPERATQDIDIAAAMGTWDDFEHFVSRLERHGRSVHSFLVEGVEVDVLPYGGIEDEDRTVLWPDDHRMNVRGLREAVASAESVLLPGGVLIKVPAVPALALLKLLTWRDRRATTTRDAVDLGTMIGWYSSGPYWDRLYDEELEVLERHGFDPALAGAWLLGSHMPGLLDADGVGVLLGIVGDEDAMGRLGNDVRLTRGPELVRVLAEGIKDVVS
ncbi:nucleotidyl transferase AbiEii/AbiGii toxin family protein [Amycolatopsis roodepoortensis]|uniref:nucleotidyl transferase AbiEii/AbiGii toxin family protein n=1 Tax=Amycolatopsis roodepoortensis TaxID=700274 RepID=UPI00214B41FB|nr:nucleotidyl transferase AbiEii/AbiGii toxin family protein [Amycolatopsis roodepoortensis]UUV34998.1 nucleotidyl transferase AbiEii/AbiGii toxin family protein [Amycolatopsis roodepoortensis]